MREIWDEEKKLKKEKHEKERQQKQLICCPVAVLSADRQALPQRTATRKRAEQLVKIRKYYFEHLELKKVALDFFPKYEEYLGEAGFSKV